jgi:hypothetical protein
MQINIEWGPFMMNLKTKKTVTMNKTKRKT